jgi:hypothetical protein
VQPLNKECIKNLVAVASSKSVLDVEGSAAQKMASPAVYTCFLPRKAALRSGAAKAAVMTSHVS